jgi:hypothetical protein
MAASGMSAKINEDMLFMWNTLRDLRTCTLKCPPEEKVAGG